MDVLVLDEALNRLARQETRQHRVMLQAAADEDAGRLRFDVPPDEVTVFGSDVEMNDHVRPLPVELADHALHGHALRRIVDVSRRMVGRQRRHARQ